MVNAKAKGNTRRKGALTAEEAFADYVSIPRHERSYTALAEIFVSRGYYENVGTARAVIGRWASRDSWQERIRQAATERAMEQLAEADELDADTLLETAKRFNELIHSPGFFDANTLARIRDSVRKPAPKGGTSVSVHLDVQISQIAERIAEDEGLNEVEKAAFMKDVEKYLAEASA